VLFNEYRSANNQKVTPPLEPVGAVIADTELFYLLPSGDITSGLLIYFHGCGHSGQDMFKLPEDRIVAMAALRRGLAVLSITSSDRTAGCWSDEDVKLISEKKVVEKWMKSVKLPSSLPRMGMGASSGGSILFSMYKALDLKSLASYIAPAGYAADEMMDSPKGKVALPATAYVHMPKDKQTADFIAKQVTSLKSLGVPTKVFEVKPHPFTLNLCDQRLPEIGDRRCHVFLRKVQEKYPHLLDLDNNVLKPYGSGEWNEVFKDSKLDDDLRHIVGAPAVHKGQADPLHFSGHSYSWAAMMEEISVSYAEHEMTCEFRNKVLDFLMKNAGIKFESEEEKRRGLLGIIVSQLS
jgi:hypothetical protein